MNKGILGLLLLCSVAYAEAPTELLQEVAVKVDYGSGSVVRNPYSGKEYILTNWHVCVNYPYQSSLIRYESGILAKSKVVYADPTKDLCVLTISNAKEHLELGSKQSIGDSIHTRGYPMGELVQSSGVLQRYDTITFNFARGGIQECPKAFKAKQIFNILSECRYTFEFGYTTLYSRPGSSGSAVVNDDGELVGVVQSALFDTPDPLDGGGGIILLKTLKQFFSDMAKKGL